MVLAFWDKLFGLPRDLMSQASKTEFGLSAHGFVLAGLIVLCLLLVAGAVLLYRRSRRIVGGRRAYTLLALRGAQLVLLFFILTIPALTIEGYTKFKSRLLVLLDDSASMEERDLAASPEMIQKTAMDLGLIIDAGQKVAEKDVEMIRALPRRELVSRVLERGDRAALRSFESRRELRLCTVSTDLKPLEGNADKGWPHLLERAAGQATYLGTALHEAVDQHRGTLSDVILISDGVNNGGLDPLLAAREAKEAGARVITVPVGSPSGMPDSILLTAIANSVVNKGDQVEVVVDVRSRGYDGKPTKVELRRGGSALDQKPLVLQSQTHQRLSLGFRAELVGTLGLTLVVVPQPDERVTANNYYQLTVRVVDEKYKALLIEGYPRWEYRFLKNLASRDHGLSVDFILQSDWQPGTPTKVPNTKEELEELDVVVVGDVDPAFFTEEQLTLIESFTSERGGGLIAIAGEDHMPSAYRDTPLENVLPIVLPDPAEPQFHRAPSQEPFHLELTPEGDAYPAMRLEEDAIANQQAWSRLPGQWWCRTSGRTRPGATALAVHSSLKNSYGPMPLIVLQRYGKGQVMYLAIDSTWRWRYTWGEAYFDRFWGQVIRNVAPERKDKHRASEITLGRNACTEGESVPISAAAFGEDGSAVDSPTLLLAVEEAGGELIPVTLRHPGDKRPGEFAGEWKPPRAGSYLVRLEGEGVTPAAARVRVGPARSELEETVTNEALLKQIADLSGGQLTDLASLGKLVEQLPKNEREVAQRTRRSLWDTWPLFVLLVAANASELILRKRWGLP